jgi:ubiquinone/menaquinone biosynthesis C-methylase UbiE
VARDRRVDPEDQRHGPIDRGDRSDDRGDAVSAYSSYDANEERGRLRLQSEVLEALSDRALARLGSLEGRRAVDVACGAMGLLRALSQRVGPSGSVVGTDVNETMLSHANDFIREQGLTNVSVVRDDVLASELPAASFDVVHSRFVLAPLGRDDQILDQLERLVAPDGWLLLEEPVSPSWRVWPSGEAHDALVEVVARAYERHMGGVDAGARLLSAARRRGWRDVGLDAEVLAMPPGHPYLRMPVLMATALRSVVLRDTDAAELDRRIAAAEALYARPETHGVTFTLVQLRARVR